MFELMVLSKNTYHPETQYEHSRDTQRVSIEGLNKIPSEEPGY